MSEAKDEDMPEKTTSEENTAPADGGTDGTDGADEGVHTVDATDHGSASHGPASDSQPLPEKGSIWTGARGWIVVIAALAAGVAAGALFFGSEPEPEPEAEIHVHDEGDSTTWTCSMHPQVQAEEPGQCPICGMDLIPVEEGGGGEALAPEQVRLTERARTLAEIQTIPVLRDPSHEMRVHLLGRLDHDETRVRTVTAWTGGRIDDLKVATTGQRIRSGQVIATIYSPEIYAAHRDLLHAKKQLATLKDAMEFSRESAKSTLESARRKLELLGVPKKEIETMENAESAWTQIRIRSPFPGTVTERLVSEGNYVQPGSGLFKLTDLSKLWVQLDAYETDLSRLSVGQSVRLTVSAFPGEIFEGQVAFIDPVVNPNTRTARVRVEVSNPEGRLRPGMFAKATVQSEATDAVPPLIIPETAPLFSGRRSVVYVEVPGTERPTYEAREVRLGPKVGDAFPVVAGLREGERVVIHGAFTLDADLQIRGGKSLMSLDDDTLAHPLDRIVDVTPDFREQLAPIIENYLKAQQALADDNLTEAKGASVELREAAESFEPPATDAASDAWGAIRPVVIRHARQFEHSTTIEGARVAFDLLSKNIARTLERFGNPLDSPLRVAYCPMAFNNRGAEWVQKEAEVENSYFGQAMHACGEIQETIPAGNYLVRKNAASDEEASDVKPAGGHQH